MRALWLIDGSYLYFSLEELRLKFPNRYKSKLDYKRLKSEIMRHFGITSMDSIYFNAVPHDITAMQDQFHTRLKVAEPDGPGIRVKLYNLKDKTVTCPSCGTEFSVQVQKGVDVAIATAALRLYKRYDAIVFSAGDGDFEDCLKYLAEYKDKTIFHLGYMNNTSADIQQYCASSLKIERCYDRVCVQFGNGNGNGNGTTQQTQKGNGRKKQPAKQKEKAAEQSVAALADETVAIVEMGEEAVAALDETLRGLEDIEEIFTVGNGDLPEQAEAEVLHVHEMPTPAPVPAPQKAEEAPAKPSGEKNGKSRNDSRKRGKSQGKNKAGFVPSGDFDKDVLAIVASIPAEKVATYGQIAAIANAPNMGRKVRNLLVKHAGDENLPVHRVIKANGDIGNGYPNLSADRQRLLLEDENVAFFEDGRISLDESQWKP